MMNFKEACSYANYLNGLINGLEAIMYNTNNFTKRSELHLRNKAYSDAPDEIIVPTVERIFEGQIQDIAVLTLKVIDEKLKLSIAIEEAKKHLSIDWKESDSKLSIDTAVEYNKNIRLLATSYLDRLTKVKTTETKGIGRSYKINIAGDQVPYTYDVEVTTEIDFDKSIVKNMYKQLLTKADKISALLDEAQAKSVVEYTAPYDVHDTIEDVIEGYIKSLK
jgi:hypothetical protein